jgi:D-serine deaminase-like pyridoxal phosphate-dependent protein
VRGLGAGIVVVMRPLRGAEVTSDLAHVAAALAGGPLPAAAVDLDGFEANVDRLVAACRRAGKRLRVATKSIRCPALLERVRARAGETLRGLMTYSARETERLAGLGWRDLLLAYPTLGALDAAALARAGAAGALASAMVDDEAQLAPLAAAARAAGVTIPVAIDVDMSLRPLGGAVHVGVRRSPLHDPAAAVALARRIESTAGLRFHGVMGYEAQVAGLPDRPGRPWMSLPVRAIKTLSRPLVAARRGEVVAALRAAGLAPAIVNGGGTGSVESTGADPSVDEVTIGSGFLAGHLFDAYDGPAPRPALLFALQVTRRPSADVVTCHMGGYVASGEPAPDRLPIPVHPRGLALLAMEGAGEVQTPLRVPAGSRLELGDVVLFRPAKSGELAEHFDDYALVRAGRVEERVPTYRGLGR